MINSALNPYLPSWEYVPDGEPHVFGKRVYVYGSHDRFNGYAFCLNDYVCWSAPVDDLGNWRYEGVIYHRTDDPANEDGEMCLYAPDVTQGEDGRYYLYYVLDQLSIVSVAVCDKPAGKYRFYGYVHHPDGILLGEKQGDQPQGDPGVLFEDHKVYLYTGFCPADDPRRLGPTVTVLDRDMLTVREAGAVIAPSKPYSFGSSFEGHEFFEASSIRKIEEKYYFVYSSILLHELCYAVSEEPTKGFRFGGTIISNNDIGIDTYKPKECPMAYGGNNHGSIECINGNWYVFYHRHTNGTGYCRQGCAEKIRILPNGEIPQTEMTCCGLNQEPLPGKGTYPAYIACNLFTEQNRAFTGDMGAWIPPEFPRITQEGKDGDQNPGYVDNLKSGANAGFKYFVCHKVRGIGIKVRGCALEGKFLIKTEPDGVPVGEIEVARSNEWKYYETIIELPDGIYAFYFEYRGQASMSLKEITFL